MDEYFHVSKEQLKSGSRLDVRYGRNILNPRFYSYSDHYHDQYLREMLFEDVRRTSFPDKPSRLNSIYLFDNLGCALKFMKQFHKDYLYSVEIADNAKILRSDMEFINLTVRKSVEEIMELAHRFYNEELNEVSNIEVLCEGEVIIKERMNIVIQHNK